MAGKVIVNGVEVTPGKKVKLTDTMPRRQIRKLIESKRAEAKEKAKAKKEKEGGQ